MTRTALLLLLTILLFAASGPAGAREVAFETVELAHLTAGELAPLLGAQFSYAGALGAPSRDAKSSAYAGLVPAGVKLITAAHQSSRYLLVAGTAQGVAELRALLRQFDVERQRMQIVVKVYPAAAEARSGWHDLPGIEGVVAAARTLGAGEALRLPPPLPRGFQPQEIVVESLQSAAEFVPLPPFENWPQVLLCMGPQVEASGRMTLAVGAGLLEGPESSETAVTQAWAMPATESLKAGESLALVLRRGDSGITLVLTPRAEQARRE